MSLRSVETADEEAVIQQIPSEGDDKDIGVPIYRRVTAGQSTDMHELDRCPGRRSSLDITSNRDVDEGQRLFEDPILGGAPLVRLSHASYNIIVANLTREAIASPEGLTPMT